MSDDRSWYVHRLNANTGRLQCEVILASAQNADQYVAFTSDDRVMSVLCEALVMEALLRIDFVVDPADDKNVLILRVRVNLPPPLPPHTPAHEMVVAYDTGPRRATFDLRNDVRCWTDHSTVQKIVETSRKTGAAFELDVHPDTGEIKQTALTSVLH